MNPKPSPASSQPRSLLRERIAKCLPPAVPHTPDFQVRDQDEFLLISEAGRPVATLHREWLILDLREFHPDGRAKATLDIRRPYHNVDFRGTIIPCNWKIRSQMVDSHAPSITIHETGPRLVLRIDETFGEDETGWFEICLSYDQQMGCYAVDKRGELALHTPCQVEAANLWDGGAGRAWPADTTLRCTLWSNAAGGLTWFPHNPLTPNLPGNLDVAGPRRCLPVGGFIAMGERDRSNPALEILDSHTAAIGCATCSAFYDEHVFLGCPTPIDDAGKYRWRFHGRYVSVPQTAFARLREQAAMLDLGDTADQYDNWGFLAAIRAAGRQVQPFDGSLPFVPGQVNPFDRPIDPRQELVGLYWYFTPQPYGRVTWDREAKALLIEGRDPRADLSAIPCGPTIRGHENTAHRLTARVRTEGEVAAWLELTPYLYSAAEINLPNRSPEAIDNTGWQTLSVDLPACPGQDYLAVALRLRGQGRAWFDQVLLKDMPA